MEGRRQGVRLMDAEQRRKMAIKRVKEKKDFRSHAFVFVAVNAMLVFIWAISGAGFFWPIFPIVFWGFGVAMHGWNAYGGGRNSISEDEIQREMNRMGDDVAE